MSALALSVDLAAELTARLPARLLELDASGEWSDLKVHPTQVDALSALPVVEITVRADSVVGRDHRESGTFLATNYDIRVWCTVRGADFASTDAARKHLVQALGDVLIDAQSAQGLPLTVRASYSSVDHDSNARTLAAGYVDITYQVWEPQWHSSPTIPPVDYVQVFAGPIYDGGTS